MNNVFWSYLKGVMWAIGITSIAYIVIISLNKPNYPYYSEKTLKNMQLVGIIFQATAFYGKLGSNHQTWSGTSTSESLDQYLSNFFSAIGIFLMILPLII